MENDNSKLKKEEILSKKIGYEDFTKIEIRVGQILSVEKVPDTDKLLKLSVDLGGIPDIRQIISGIALHFPDLAVLVGRKCMFVTNLEPRVIRGLESQGMILALSTDDGKFSLLEPSSDIPPGTMTR